MMMNQLQDDIGAGKDIIVARSLSGDNADLMTLQNIDSGTPPRAGARSPVTSGTRMSLPKSEFGLVEDLPSIRPVTPAVERSAETGRKTGLRKRRSRRPPRADMGVPSPISATIVLG